MPFSTHCHTTLRRGGALASVVVLSLAVVPALRGDPPGNVVFTLGDAAARAGRALEVPFTIRADAPFQGFEFSVDFDEALVHATSVEKRWRRPGGGAWDFEVFHMNNNDATAGNAGVDEGFIAGRAVIDSTDPAAILPAGEDVEVLTFALETDEAAPPGPADLRFLDGATGFGDSFANKLFAEGGEVTPASAESFVLADGVVTIGPPGPFFIRGDANSDGLVSIADSRYLAGYMFLGTAALSCVESGDTTSDGTVNIADVQFLLNHLYLGGPQPEAPFPEPGRDDDDDGLECAETGTGAPLEDPVARLELVDVVVPGGASADAAVTLRMSNSTEIGALDGVIEAPEPIFGPWSEDEQLWGAPIEDFLGLERVADFRYLESVENRLEFALLLSISRPVAFPPGEAVDVLRIRFCLAEGTPAGEYPLELTEVEFADTESGMPIYPALGGATLTVLEDVTGTECNPFPPPDESEKPENIEFRIHETQGGRGDTVGVPFTIRADRPSQGFEFSVDFDEGVLRATDVVRRWNRPDGTPYDFEVYEVDNEDRVPGSDGVDEGFIAGAAIISLTDSASVLPPDEPVEVLRFVFLIDEAAPLGPSELRFLDGAIGSAGRPVANNLIAGGEHVTPELADSFLFVNGAVNILPDGALFNFLRGDSNGDRGVNIADPEYTLNHLFLGGPAPPCLDAADANDDGKIDISDPMATLNFLFRGQGSLPEPTGAPGRDPTPDGLECAG